MTEKERPSSPQPDRIQTSQYQPEDEINIFDLLEVLVRKKVLIFFTTSIFTFLSIIYVFSVTPIYRATIGFQSSEKGLTLLFPDFIAEILPDTSRSEKGSIVREKDYLIIKFLTEFQSYLTQEKVFIEGEFLQRFDANDPNVDIRKRIVQEINRSIHVSDSGNGKQETANKITGQTIIFEMEGTKPELISDFLNVLAERAKREVVNSAKESMRQGIKVLLDKYSAELEKLHSKEQAEKASKARRFSDNLEIAKNLGIVDNNFGGPTTNISLSLGSFPIWYLYGQRALEQELKVLERRAASSQYTEQTAELDYKMSYLSKIDLSKINFEPVIISRHSIPPVNPININKTNIIAMGIVLGLTIGIVFAFLSNSMAQLKERSKFS